MTDDATSNNIRLTDRLDLAVDPNTTREGLIREAVRQLTSLPRKGTPVADLTEGEKLALCIAAGAPTETTIENGRLVMRTAVQCGVVDRGDGGYIVAVGAREPMVTYLVESDKTMKLSEQLKQDCKSGDFGRSLDGYAERAALLEDAAYVSVIHPKVGEKREC